MNKCICKNVIMVENNKEFNCKSRMHDCICDYNHTKCLSYTHHKCICSTVADSNNCRAHNHYCICRSDSSSKCKLVNKYNTQLDCYIKHHQCICYKSNSCLAIKHECVCKEMPFRCKSEENHLCICKNDSRNCKALRHKKPCFIIRFYRWLRYKKPTSSYSSII